MPMLAERFDKKAHKIKYPAFIQPKLDGVRAVYSHSKNNFTSRSGLPIGQGSHNILNELRNANWPNGPLALDGELYAHGLSFQNVMKLVNSNDSKLTFSVYDYAGTSSPFSERHQTILRFFEANKGFKHVKYVQTSVVHSAEDVKKFHDRYVNEGYEGAIVRNAHGVYTESRSNDLQKVKEFQDAEFTVVGHKKDVSGKVLWVCLAGAAAAAAAAGPRTFTVKPNSSDVISNEINNGSVNPESLMGRKYTVKFQELTDDGIPRFPVGIGFKDLRDIQKSARAPSAPKPKVPSPEVIDLVDDDEVIELDDEGEVVRPFKKIRVSSPKRSPRRSPHGSPRRAGGAGGSPRRSPHGSPRRAGGAGGSPRGSPRRSSPPRPKSPAREPKRTGGKTVGKDRGCEQQFTAKYTSRSSPPYPANNCCGRHIKGNDGNMYTSVKNSAGICTWKQGEF